MKRFLPSERSLVDVRLQHQTAMSAGTVALGRPAVEIDFTGHGVERFAQNAPLVPRGAAEVIPADGKECPSGRRRLCNVTYPMLKEIDHSSDSVGGRVGAGGDDERGRPAKPMRRMGAWISPKSQVSDDCSDLSVECIDNEAGIIFTQSVTPNHI